MTVDLICCARADRVNPKPLIVTANLLAAVGLWFGRHGEAGQLRPWMLGGAALSALAHLVISSAPGAVWSLAAGAPAGLFVRLLWPGVIARAAARVPRAGGSMCAFLALTCLLLPNWLARRRSTTAH